MTRHDALYLEIVYDLSYLAGLDDLHALVEDSRVLLQMIKEWATEFDVKYPMPRVTIVDFSELYGDDYITAIDKFYIEKRNEFMAEEYNITSKKVLNLMFKNQC